jgi:Bacterial PH domain
MSPIPDEVRVSSSAAAVTSKPSPETAAHDDHGRVEKPRPYHMPARLSVGIIVFYLLLIAVITYLGAYRIMNEVIAEVLDVALIVYLGRYMSTRYRLTPYTFAASRLFGSRRIPIEEIRRVVPANLRDLAPASFFGSWGWRGRMWSPQIGPFDTVHTASEGLLVSGGTGVPVFISPTDPDGFATELSRRVRSYHPDVDILGSAE